MVILCCQYTVNEAQKLVPSCLQLRSIFRPEKEEYKELSFLALYLEYGQSFSAAGFFNIDKKSLLDVISIVSTLMIVIMTWDFSSSPK